MKTSLAIAAIIFGAAFAYSITTRAQETATATTIWDKVYTEQQATRGKEAYMEICAQCHSEDLGGNGYAPALKGEEFASAWTDKTVGDFFDRIRKLMPPDDPGSLPPDTYRDIIAFVLQENKYPAGEHEMPAESAALRQIKITTTNPK